MKLSIVLVLLHQLLLPCSDGESVVPMGAVPVSDVLNNMLRLERTVNNLTWVIGLSRTEQENTKADLKSTKMELKITKAELQTTKAELQATKSDLETTKTLLKYREEKTTDGGKLKGWNSEVSFEVKQIQHPYTPDEYQPLTFDDVTLNKGEMYEPTSGFFNVPTNGTYFCWANVMGNGDSYFTVRLMNRGQCIIKGYTGMEQRHGVATISYITTFNRGEQVWFDLKKGKTLEIHGKNYSSYGCSLTYV